MQIIIIVAAFTDAKRQIIGITKKITRRCLAPIRAKRIVCLSAEDDCFIISGLIFADEGELAAYPKTPDLDGLLQQFYIRFISMLCSVLLNVYVCCFGLGTLPRFSTGNHTV